MTEHPIQFDKLKWEKPAEGVAQKIYTNGAQRIRLLKFNDTFFEADWCTNGHVGFVLKGEMKINFNGHITQYKEGNGLWIEAGEKSKHKVIIEKGKHVELVLFESNTPLLNAIP